MGVGDSLENAFYELSGVAFVVVRLFDDAVEKFL